MVDKQAYFSHCPFRRGAVAQLGERLNGIQEAVGSIPSSSTRNLKPPIITQMVGGFCYFTANLLGMNRLDLYVDYLLF